VFGLRKSIHLDLLVMIFLCLLIQFFGSSVLVSLRYYMTLKVLSSFDRLIVMAALISLTFLRLQKAMRNLVTWSFQFLNISG